MAATATDYGFDTTIMPSGAANFKPVPGQASLINDAPDPWDAVSTPAPSAPPTAQADPWDAVSTPAPANAQQPDSWDSVSAPASAVIPPLSEDELKNKMTRWGPILRGDKIGSPADFIGMEASGKFTPGQLTRAQTESSLRQTYIQQQAQTLGQKAGSALSSGWGTVKNIAQDVTPGLRDYQTYEELAANPAADITENGARVANSMLEGGYGAASSIGGIAKGLITGPLSYIKTAVQGPRTPAQAEQDYQDWKKNYIANNAVPGYAPPPPSAVQGAVAYYTGAKPEDIPAPVAPLTSLAGFAASLPAFGAAGKVAGAVIPKVLKATGVVAALPNLSKLVTPLSQAAKLRDAMVDATGAASKAVGEGVAPALDTTLNKTLPATEATPEQAAAIQAANATTPSLGDRVAVAITSGVSKLGQFPGQAATATAAATGRGLVKAGELATKPAEWLNKLWGTDSSLGSYLKYKFLEKIPGISTAISVVKSLEGTGKVAQGVGDLMTRIAEADPTDPMGRFAAAAQAAPAGHWMKALAQNSGIKMALNAADTAIEAAKGVAKGAATGAALSAVTGANPQETGSNIAGFLAFGGLEGGMSAAQNKIFHANISGVSKFVNDSIAPNSGSSVDTLKLVPASDIMTAVNLKSVLPGYTVKFSTPDDAGTKFVKGTLAEGQAGIYDRANKTIWINPKLRQPGSTLLHEAFHPIFDELVNQHPEIKESLDAALARNGNTIDDFTRQYANRVVGASNPETGSSPDRMPTTVAAARYIESQNTDDPTGNWRYSEMLSETASHNLLGKDLLQAMQGNDVQQSATQAALQGVQGWLSDNGVRFQEGKNPGTIFPDFKDSFNDPTVRRMTYQLLKAKRDSLLNPTPAESSAVPLTTEAMGGQIAPGYTDLKTGKKINQFGEFKPDPSAPSGEKFVRFPASEMRRRGEAEKAALAGYFPDKNKRYTVMPPGLEDNPDIQPWTKNTLRTAFDSIKSNHRMSFWNQGLAGGKSSISDAAWASRTARDLGNVEASYQEVRPVGVGFSGKKNLLLHADSESAENQKLAAWGTQHGPISLDLWGADPAKAKADIAIYKDNLATGKPGETGIGVDKRNVLNALLAGNNKEFQDTNPLRKLLKAKDRAATFRTFRPDRMGAIVTEPTDIPPTNWDRAKPNLSPGDFSPAAEPPKRMIELTGPEGKKYPAKYDGLQENFTGGPPFIQITPQADLPGATSKFSTTYAHSLMKKGYMLPKDLLDEVKAHVAANPPQSMQFSPSDDPKAVASAAVRDKKNGRVFTGISHGDAAAKSPKFRKDSLEDGFVTNDGTFLNRDDAYAKAVAAQQYKPTDEDYNVNKILYGLTSERFNKQNPGAVIKASQAGKTPEKTPDYAKMDAEWAAKQAKKNGKNGRYSPAAPESLTSAAVRIDHDETIRKQAEGYAKEQGMPHAPYTGYAPLNEDLGKRVADAYEAAPHIPNDPKVQASYQALANETEAQWDYLTKQGVKFEPWTKEGQPYKNSAAMRQDVQDNKHLYFFPTEGGFGEGAQGSNNPMLQPTGDKIAPVVNDMFRSVHDYFGHAKEGYEFGPRGEHNAFLAHSRMFSEAAHPALAAETMGQNSWVNFGKHLRDAEGDIPAKGEQGYVPPAERPYAEQKSTALPDELMKESMAPASDTFSPAAKEDEKLSYPMEMAPGKASGLLPALAGAPYGTRLLYQRQMLKAMKPLFAAFDATPGATKKSSYVNSAGETEHNPMTSVDVPAAQAKLFGLLHGHFANQEAVAGGFKETSPGKWEPVGPNSFDERGDQGTSFADKIKALGPQAAALLAKLEPKIGPAVDAVNKKWAEKVGEAQQLPPSAAETSEPAPFVPTGVLKHHASNPAVFKK
jgi:hypothetical protein